MRGIQSSNKYNYVSKFSHHLLPRVLSCSNGRCTGTTSLNNCSAVKTPTVLEPELLVELFKLLYLTTTTILYIFSKIRSTTWPIDVVVVTQGGGLLIIVIRGAFNSVQSSRCNSPTQLPQSSTIGTTWSQKKRITTFFKWRVPSKGLAAFSGIMMLSIGSLGDTWTERLNSSLSERFTWWSVACRLSNMTLSYHRWKTLSRILASTIHKRVY